MQSIFGVRPTKSATSTGEMVQSMAKIQALEDQLTKGHAGVKRKHNNHSPKENAKKVKNEVTPEVLPSPLQDPPVPEIPLLLTEQEENEVTAFLANLQNNVTTAEVGTQTDPPPQSLLISDLSCPVHEWEPLCPRSCGEFHYER